MLEKILKIQNKLGLHARAAAKLVALASRHACEIEIRKGNHCVNGKSIMGVMMLAATQGSELTFCVSGEDEVVAMTEIEALINNRFGEKE